MKAYLFVTTFWLLLNLAGFLFDASSPSKKVSKAGLFVASVFAALCAWGFWLIYAGWKG